jgi:Ser/Thr protein kinase RdoA (MazF antagonist)
MYEFRRGREEYILRIAHSLRRSEALIHGEVDWINYLSAGGASVARAVLSDEGRLVETVDDASGGAFLATAFVRAKGRPPEKSDWTPPFFEIYGRLLGRIHALSKTYVPADPAWQRPDWNDPVMLEVERFLPESDSRIVERYHALLEYLIALPRNVASYGMIHQDAHGGNLFVDEDGSITLFDFDDCVYSWYMNDIAIVLFYAVIGREDVEAFTREFLTGFLHGYTSETELDTRWLKEIPYFLKLREIDLYAVIHRSFDVNNLDPWCSRYMHNRKERIQSGTPYIDFDFDSFAKFL